MVKYQMIKRGERSRFYRLWEIFPGFLAWNIILFPIWGAFFVPKAVAYFVVAFLIFWLYRSFKASFLGFFGLLKIKKETKTNWYEKYRLEKQRYWLKWEEIKHLVIIPNYNESVKTLSKNLDCLACQKQIKKENFVVVLAMEERAKDAHQRAAILVKKYKASFGKIITAFHPANIEGEVIGKASNEAWAAKKAKALLVDKLGWDIKKITVTSCDADACFHPRYFSALTYYFAKSKKRYLRFWQSPMFWYNNLNRVPSPIRIIGIIGNVAHVSDLQDPEGLLFNYSAYSLSLKLLVDIGYWDRDIIPEDWHIFLQAFFAKKGKVNVEPIFTPTNIDAPEGKNYFEALKNRYLQCQRHAWGATDIPYAIDQARKHPEVPIILKLLRIYKLIESHLIWSTNWFILTLGASLPPILNPKFFQTAIGYNLPKFSQFILTVCLVALGIIIILDWNLRPKADREMSFLQKLAHLLQWLLMPVATLFLAVIPGLHAQTKLMVGKRLEYWVTKKY